MLGRDKGSAVGGKALGTDHESDAALCAVRSDESRAVERHDATKRINTRRNTRALHRADCPILGP